MDTSMKAINETSYLTATNVGRYRTILRYFFREHERMRQYLFPNEIYHYMKSVESFEKYTEEELAQDLQQLTIWKNIIARQETGNVKSIEEFKKKRYRYQCSPYTVEIERMVLRLESMGTSFGGSLEKTLFEKVYRAILELEKLRGQVSPDKENCHQAWDDVFSYFQRIIQESSDYIAYLSSENVEERMMTEAFLIFKDRFTMYLRDFILYLQQAAIKIEELLKGLNEREMKPIFQVIAEYERDIPRLDDKEKSFETLLEECEGKWGNLRRWFIGSEGKESELYVLQIETTNIIRRITRIVQRLSERTQHFRSRKNDYLHGSKLFSEMDDLEDANKLSSVLFGVAHTRHFHVTNDVTEDIYCDVWDEVPSTFEVKPRVRTYREKTRAHSVIEHDEEKQNVLRAYLAQQKQEKKEIEALIIDNMIVLEQLPMLQKHQRKVLLTWVAKAMGQESRKVKTELGRTALLKEKEGRITLRSTDGSLEMPNVEFVFED